MKEPRVDDDIEYLVRSAKNGPVLFVGATLHDARVWGEKYNADTGKPCYYSSRKRGAKTAKGTGMGVSRAFFAVRASKTGPILFQSLDEHQARNWAMKRSKSGKPTRLFMEFQLEKPVAAKTKAKKQVRGRPAKQKAKRRVPNRTRAKRTTKSARRSATTGGTLRARGGRSRVVPVTPANAGRLVVGRGRSKSKKGKGGGKSRSVWTVSGGAMSLGKRK